MLELATVFFTSFILAFSGAMMPGPLLTATIGESARKGSHVGFVLMIGHAVLEMAMVAALLYGLGPFLKKDSVFAAIALTGSAILFWMAFGMFRALPGISINWDAKGETSKNLVLTGILVSASNPYWTIWWATIGLGYIMSCIKFGPPGVVLFFLGHISGDIVWYGAVSILVAKGRHLLSDRIYRTLIGICAGFLILFGGYFAFSGIEKLKDIL